jgi:hypothetical protein
MYTKVPIVLLAWCRLVDQLRVLALLTPHIVVHSTMHTPEMSLEVSSTSDATQAHSPHITAKQHVSVRTTRTCHTFELTKPLSEMIMATV